MIVFLQKQLPNSRGNKIYGHLGGGGGGGVHPVRLGERRWRCRRHCSGGGLLPCDGRRRRVMLRHFLAAQWWSYPLAFMQRCLSSGPCPPEGHGVDRTSGNPLAVGRFAAKPGEETPLGNLWDISGTLVGHILLQKCPRHVPETWF